MKCLFNWILKSLKKRMARKTSSKARKVKFLLIWGPTFCNWLQWICSVRSLNSLPAMKFLYCSASQRRWYHLQKVSWKLLMAIYSCSLYKTGKCYCHVEPWVGRFWEEGRQPFCKAQPGLSSKHTHTHTHTHTLHSSQNFWMLCQAFI